MEEKRTGHQDSAVLAAAAVMTAATATAGVTRVVITVKAVGTMGCGEYSDC